MKSQKKKSHQNSSLSGLLRSTAQYGAQQLTNAWNSHNHNYY